MARVLQMMAVVGSILFCSAARAEAPESQLQALLEDFQAEYGFPGATAATVDRQGRIVSVATGLADAEAGIPMVPDSRMLAASIGKSFVAALVLSIEDDGVLRQSDTAALHIGDRDWFAQLPNHDTMTIGDLMRHAAGLPDHVHDDDFATAMRARVVAGSGALPPEDAIAFILDAAPLFPAGSGWSYSDTGYLLLGLVIEEVTGARYYDLVEERFLNPLSLDATSPSDNRQIAGLAVGYTLADNPFGFPPRTTNDAGQLVWDPAMEWTGGGLVSTSHDLALWGHALFGGTAMPEPYLERLLDGVPVSPDAPDVFYGAGVAIYTETPRGPVYGHGGWIPDYVSSLRHYLDHDVTVAFQINTDVGIADDSTDLVPALEAAIADLAIGLAGEGTE